SSVNQFPPRVEVRPYKQRSRLPFLRRMRSLLLLLPLVGVVHAVKTSPIDPNFAEALARLCQLSPTHSLCSRVQILDHIPADASPMVKKRNRATTVAPTTQGTTKRSKQGKIIRDEQEEESREFFRSIADEIAIDLEGKKPEIVEPRRVSTPLRSSSSFSRFQREPPAAPRRQVVQATTPSLWDWMNPAEKEGYLFEEDQEERNEIFKKRWMKALRARKARRRAVHAVRTDRRESGPLAALSDA
ncbi:hypothetical protein PMAYCL1PPCAC_07895, partial [Pristionchus mayeri]